MRNPVTEQKLPHLTPLAVHSMVTAKKSLWLRRHGMNQRHINFCPLTPALAQVLINRGQSNLMTFFQRGPLQPYLGKPLLRGRARFPFGYEFLQARLHSRPHRQLSPSAAAQTGVA